MPLCKVAYSSKTDAVEIPAFKTCVAEAASSQDGRGLGVNDESSAQV
jgi:hypothetical protein